MVRLLGQQPPLFFLIAFSHCQKEMQSAIHDIQTGTSRRSRTQKSSERH
jgi:hypothetical protein